MIDFSQDTVFNLRPTDEKNIRRDVKNLYIPSEETIGVFKTIRDQVVFTNKRIITIDVQGVTGMRKDYCSLPYSKIQYYCIQTPGFAEIISDCELMLFFANGMKVIFEFKGNCDILAIGRCISEYALG